LTNISNKVSVEVVALNIPFSRESKMENVKEEYFLLFSK
jgi:hypothetical protein